MSKLSDSSCYGKITHSTTTFMKKRSKNKVIQMDENALEIIVSAYDGDLWCQVMPFQVQSYSRHFQHLLSHIHMHQFCFKRKITQQKRTREEKTIEKHIRTKRKVNQKRSEKARGYSTILRDQKKRVLSIHFLFYSFPMLYLIFSFFFL